MNKSKGEEMPLKPGSKDLVRQAYVNLSMGKATLIPNLALRNTRLWKRLWEWILRINPELYHHPGSYPATTLAPNRSSITVPLDLVSAVESGWHATWATPCLLYKFCPVMRPIVQNGEETPSSSLMLTQMFSIHNHSRLEETYY